MHFGLVISRMSLLLGRTPHYGAMTPSYDGGRTPIHSSAWDPSTTPAHPVGDDIRYDEPFSVPSSGSMNPHTPGYNPDSSSLGEFAFFVLRFQSSV